MGRLKNKLREIGASRVRHEEQVSVLVELSLRTPNEACIKQLQDVGLTIEEIIGNKVVGHIAGQSEAELESLPIVASVERSVQLKPHH